MINFSSENDTLRGLFIRWMDRMRNRTEAANSNFESFSMPKTMINAEKEIAAIM